MNQASFYNNLKGSSWNGNKQSTLGSKSTINPAHPQLSSSDSNSMTKQLIQSINQKVSKIASLQQPVRRSCSGTFTNNSSTKARQGTNSKNNSSTSKKSLHKNSQESQPYKDYDDQQSPQKNAAQAAHPAQLNQNSAKDSYSDVGTVCTQRTDQIERLNPSSSRQLELDQINKDPSPYNLLLKQRDIAQKFQIINYQMDASQNSKRNTVSSGECSKGELANRNEDYSQAPQGNLRSFTNKNGQLGIIEQKDENETTNSKTSTQMYYVDDNDDIDGDEVDEGSDEEAEEDPTQTNLKENPRIELHHHASHDQTEIGQQHLQEGILHNIVSSKASQNSKGTSQTGGLQQQDILNMATRNNNFMTLSANQQPVHPRNYEQFQQTTDTAFNNHTMDMDSSLQNFLNSTNQTNVTFPAGNHQDRIGGPHRFNRNKSTSHSNQARLNISRNLEGALYNQTQQQEQDQSIKLERVGGKGGRNSKKAIATCSEKLNADYLNKSMNSSHGINATISPHLRDFQPKNYDKYTDSNFRSGRQGQDKRHRRASRQSRQSKESKAAKAKKNFASQSSGIPTSTFAKEKRGLLYNEPEQIHETELRRNMQSVQSRISQVGREYRSQTSQSQLSHHQMSISRNRDFQNNSSLSRSRSCKRGSRQRRTGRSTSMGCRSIDEPGLLTQPDEGDHHSSINLNINNNQPTGGALQYHSNQTDINPLLYGTNDINRHSDPGLEAGLGGLSAQQFLNNDDDQLRSNTVYVDDEDSSQCQQSSVAVTHQSIRRSIEGRQQASRQHRSRNSASRESDRSAAGEESRVSHSRSQGINDETNEIDVILPEQPCQGDEDISNKNDLASQEEGISELQTDSQRRHPENANLDDDSPVNQVRQPTSQQSKPQYVKTQRMQPRVSSMLQSRGSTRGHSEPSTTMAASRPRQSRISKAEQRIKKQERLLRHQEQQLASFANLIGRRPSASMKRQEYVASNDEKERQQEREYSESLRMVGPAQRSSSAQRLGTQQNHATFQAHENDTNSNKNQTAGGHNILEVHHTQTTSLLTAQFQIADNGNGQGYDHIGENSDRISAPPLMVENTNSDYYERQNDAGIGQPLAHADVLGVADSQRQHAHQIKIFEPEVSQPTAMKNNRQSTRSSLNRDGTDRGEQCMNYSDYVKNIKSREASQEQTQRPQKAPQRKTKKNALTKRGSHASGASSLQKGGQPNNRSRRGSQLFDLDNRALNQANKYQAGRSTGIPRQRVPRSQRKQKQSKENRGPRQVDAGRFDSSGMDFIAIGGGVVDTDTKLKKDQINSLNQTMKNYKPYAFGAGRRAVNSSVMTTQASVTLGKSSRCGSSLASVSNNKPQFSRKKKQRVNSILCQYQEQSMNFPLSEAQPPQPRISTSGKHIVQEDFDSSSHHGTALNNSSFPQYSQLAQDGQVDQAEIIPSQEQQRKQHRRTGSGRFAAQVYGFSQPSNDLNEGRAQGQNILNEAEDHQYRPPQSQELYKGQMEPNGAGDLMRNCKEQQNNLDGLQDNFEAMDQNQRQPIEAPLEAECQEEEAMIQDQQERREQYLHTINELHTSPTAENSQCSARRKRSNEQESDFRRQDLKRPQMLESKTLRNLNNKDIKLALLQNFDRTMELQKINLSTGRSQRSYGRSASAQGRTRGGGKGYTKDDRLTPLLRPGRLSTADGAASALLHLPEDLPASAIQRKYPKISHSNSALKVSRYQASSSNGHSSFFDNQKSTIVQNQVTHKTKVTNLKNQFLSQKTQEKRLLQSKVCQQKKKIVQAHKQTKLTSNEVCMKFEQTKEIKVTLKKRQQQVQILSHQRQALDRELCELNQDVNEIKNLKRSLKAEIESEKKLINDIAAIAQKYKKLITEQRREKERLAQQVKSSAKIMTNLQQRRDTLIDDNNRLYDDFRQTLEQDTEDL